MPNPVAYFELGGRNAANLKEFYSDLFGWNIEAAGQSGAGTDYFHIEQTEDGISGGIIQTSGEMPPSYVMFYVSVEDIQASLDKAESLGGTTLVPRYPFPETGATSPPSRTPTATSSDCTSPKDIT